MEQENADDHLSEMSTSWSAFRHAHSSEEDKAQLLRGALLQRYRGAVRRYLLGVVRDADAADDLSQEFALRFLRGDFHKADPQRGRFRDYLKTALIHLISDYRRALGRRPKPLPESVAAPENADDERAFLDSWRREVLTRTWKTLRERKPDYYAVFRLRSNDADLSSNQMAEKLAPMLRKTVTADWVRQTLHRASAKFADLLVEEVSSSLEMPTDQTLREELEELDLVRYCRSALRARRRDSSGPTSFLNQP